MPYGTVPSSGGVNGIGSINGKKCMVIAHDATVKGGTLFPISLTKSLRAQRIAAENRLPCVYVVDSGGAFLPLQADIFNPGGATFGNIAKMSGDKISQIALVAGSCTAGGAYIPTMCDEVVIVDKISSIFLGGPPLVQAATGEVVTPEQLGGARLHCETSGYTDHLALTEEEGIEMTRDIVSMVNCYSMKGAEKLEDKEVDVSSSVAMVRSILDGGRIISNFKKTYSRSITTAFGQLDGHLVGIVANEEGHVLDDKAMNKAAHFVRLCSERDDVRMLIFLQNTSFQDSQSITTGHARYMQAVATCSTPRVTILTGHQAEEQANLLSPQCFDPNFLYRWPNAGYMDYSAVQCSALCWDDGLIMSAETRPLLAKLMKVVKKRNLGRLEPVYKM